MLHFPWNYFFYELNGIQTRGGEGQWGGEPAVIKPLLRTTIKGKTPKFCKVFIKALKAQFYVLNFCFNHGIAMISTF